MSKLELGFNKDISNQDYHDDREYISSSGLKMMYKDPRSYYKAYILGEKETFNQSAMDLGSYIHALILEPHLIEKEFAVFTGAMRRGKEWEEFQKDVGDRIIITRSQKSLADELVKNFLTTKVIIGAAENEKEVALSSFYTDGNAEETLCVEIDGVKVKVRFDYRKEWDSFGSINDIKTTAAEADSPEKVEEICRSFSYDISAALYVDAVTKHTGKPHDFYFTFMSKADKQSYMYKASEQMLEEGRRKYKIALERLKEARRTGVYYKNVIREINSI